MRFAVIDLETTGGNPTFSRVIEIAIYISDGSQIIDEYATLVNPEMEIPEFIENFTGIKNEMVVHAPKFAEIADRVLSLTEDCIFVAHNASFDYKMLRVEYKKLGIDYRKERICTVNASRRLIKGQESYSLGKLCRSLGIRLENRHRATGDALATSYLFHRLHALTDGNFEDHIASEFDVKTLNPRIQIDSLDEYPSKRGLVQYFDEHHQLLYIVYSEDIQANLRKVIAKPKSIKNKNLLLELISVEFEVIESEIMGQLKENFIKQKLKPKYNVLPKKGSFTYGIFQGEQSKHFIASMSKSNAIPVFELRNKREISKLSKVLEVQIEDMHFANNYLFQEKLNILNNRYLILQQGRHKNEKTMFWIENGEFIGYGYIPAQVTTIKNKSKLLRYIKYRSQSGSSSTIVLNYCLLNNPELILI